MHFSTDIGCWFHGILFHHILLSCWQRNFIFWDPPPGLRLWTLPGNLHPPYPILCSPQSWRQIDAYEHSMKELQRLALFFSLSPSHKQRKCIQLSSVKQLVIPVLLLAVLCCAGNANHLESLHPFVLKKNPANVYQYVNYYHYYYLKHTH